MQSHLKHTGLLSDQLRLEADSCGREQASAVLTVQTWLQLSEALAALCK